MYQLQAAFYYKVKILRLMVMGFGGGVLIGFGILFSRHYIQKQTDRNFSTQILRIIVK